jgi:hypothetical protein
VVRDVDAWKRHVTVQFSELEAILEHGICG